jgi:folate-binding protein YgfZ
MIASLPLLRLALDSIVLPMNTATDLPLPIGAARAPRAELDALLREPVACALDAELGVIAVRGADAATFLQGQLTNDTKALDATAVQLTAYCTAKGRLLAVFEQWRTDAADGEVLLQLPRELLPALLKRLSMFVLRAKARLTDASSEWHTVAVLGQGCGAALRSALGAVPEAGRTIAVDDVRVTAAPLGTRAIERYVLRAPQPAAAALHAAVDGMMPVSSGVWWWSQVDAAVPTVVAATQEAFVPQMINLEVLGGVNFKKGCYPGQEVVARSQYLGKLRRRMNLGHCADDTLERGAGDDVFFAGAAEPAGKVVASALAPGGGMDVLFECPMDRLDPAAVRLAGDVPLVLRPLPYVLVDVTA